MSAKLVQEQSTQINELTPVQQDDLTPSMPPTDLPYDDGEPLESNRHRIAMNVLIEGVHQAYQGREDYFAGGNMFVYYSSQQVRNRDFRGPDFFVTLDVDGREERRSWILWEEMGRYPNVIVELMSPSTASQDTGVKKRLYEQTFQTRDYFVYDPFDRESLQGWHLGSNGRYDAIAPDDRGWLWCETLGLWVGLWEGEILRETATWVRFYDPDGNLILLGTEQAEYERQEKERERQEKEAAQQRADLAESNLQEKEEELASLEEHQQKMRDRLLELGVDPNTL
ncbi:MAG: Uma2 family endonuclease [Cyanobacteria bacterium SBLK]|nr:Uma2 family endonuclease [Cyanobacteria bacterium SBLK]